MSTRNPNDGDSTRKRLPEGMIGGGILVAIGLVTLFGQFFNSSIIGMLVLPAFALIFLAAGFVGRNFGLMVPAGIFSGLSIGVLLVQLDAIKNSLDDQQQGSVMLFALAGGFALITLYGLLVNHFAWWPLIPAGVLALVGLALVIGPAGIKALEILNYIWPLALIVLGVWILYSRNRMGGQPRS